MLFLVLWPTWKWFPLLFFGSLSLIKTCLNTIAIQLAFIVFIIIVYFFFPRPQMIIFSLIRSLRNFLSPFFFLFTEPNLFCLFSLGWWCCCCIFVRLYFYVWMTKTKDLFVFIICLLVSGTKFIPVFQYFFESKWDTKMYKWL